MLWLYPGIKPHHRGRGRFDPDPCIAPLTFVFSARDPGRQANRLQTRRRPSWTVWTAGFARRSTRSATLPRSGRSWLAELGRRPLPLEVGADRPLEARDGELVLVDGAPHVGLGRRVQLLGVPEP